MSGRVNWYGLMIEEEQELQWSACTFKEMGTRLFHDIVQLRVNVFVVEQDCPYPELDGLDPDALHVTGRSREGAVVAYARILPPDADGYPHVGRVVVAGRQRRKGLGGKLMEHTLAILDRHYGSKRSMVAAQAHLQHFYQRFGYVPKGTEYLLDGIPHVDMLRGDR